MKFPKFLRRNKNKLDKAPKIKADKKVTFNPAMPDHAPKPRKAKRPRSQLTRVMKGITGFNMRDIGDRRKRQLRNLKGHGVAHRLNPNVRRHDDEGNGVGPTTRVKNVGNPKHQSKYKPWVEDAKHAKNAERRANRKPVEYDTSLQHEEAA